MASLADVACTQAPAANHKGSQKALQETFKLTNISPQVGKGFNRCVPWRCIRDRSGIPSVLPAAYCRSAGNCCLRSLLEAFHTAHNNCRGDRSSNVSGTTGHALSTL